MSKMLDRLRQVLSYQLTIAEVLGIAVVFGTPGSIVSWPVLLFSNVCMT